MKRDDDLIRTILFELEDDDDFLSCRFALSMSSTQEQRQKHGHLLLLVDAGFVEMSGNHDDMARMTNHGHDFLASIRNDTTWNKVKDFAAKGGGSALSVLFDVAVALVKAKIAEQTELKI